MTQETVAPSDPQSNVELPAKQDKIKEKSERREIKGNIPYVASPGVLKSVLEQIIIAERPDKFSANFMETVLKMTGGSAKAVPPFLKKMQFIGSDGTPTSLYSKFKTDGGRSQAAYDGLRNAFSELFRRNEYIHRADEATVKDIIVEITGLKKSDQIVRLIWGTFDSVRSFIVGETTVVETAKASVEDDNDDDDLTRAPSVQSKLKLGLAYQINIVLPETDNISVFNAIFRSLRENLLK